MRRSRVKSTWHLWSWLNTVHMPCNPKKESLLLVPRVGRGKGGDIICVHKHLQHVAALVCECTVKPSQRIGQSNMHSDGNIEQEWLWNSWNQPRIGECARTVGSWHLHFFKGFAVQSSLLALRLPMGPIHFYSAISGFGGKVAYTWTRHTFIYVIMLSLAFCMFNVSPLHLQHQY